MSEKSVFDSSGGGGGGSSSEASDAAQSTTAMSKSAVSNEEPVPANKNSLKRARQFDLTSLMESARSLASENNRARMQKEADAGFANEQAASQQKTTTISSQDESDDDDDVIGPTLPSTSSTAENTDLSEAGPSSKADSGVEDTNDEDYEAFELTVEQLIPAGCEATIVHGTKPVSAICLDAQGTKMASGGFDYMVKLYEFNSMDSGMKAARELMPVDSHVITGLAYNSNGENLLVSSGNAQIYLLDRKGVKWTEIVKGDQYIVDMSHTKGHCAGITAAIWHPYLKDEFMSAAEDGSIRLWTTNDYKPVTKVINKHKALIKTKSAQGKKCNPTAIAFSSDAKLIAAGCDDGSLLIWKYGKYVNTFKCARGAHAAGTVTGVAFSYDNTQLLSRSMDDTLKLWDLKSFKDPVHVAAELENVYRSTSCVFSPRDEVCVTGTSTRKGQGSGKLVFFDRATFAAVYQIEYPDVSVVKLVWHPKINQIYAGLSDGQIKVYYDQTRSVRGVMTCVTRPKKRERKPEIITDQMIISPLTLPMFQPRGEEGQEKEVTAWRLKKLLRQQAQDPTKSFRKPQMMPMSGPSAGGRIAEGASSFHAHFLQELGVTKNKGMSEDPDVRGSILRHADAAAKNPIFIGKIYDDKPKLFQEKTTIEEPKDELEPVYKRSRVIE